MYSQLRNNSLWAFNSAEQVARIKIIDNSLTKYERLMSLVNAGYNCKALLFLSSAGEVIGVSPVFSVVSESGSRAFSMVTKLLPRRW